MVVITEPNPILAQLLTDIEFFGGRNKADFINICNRNPGFYGSSGSKIRRQYQYARDRLQRRKTAIEYRDLCLACDVAPCAVTQQEAKMEELRKEMAEFAVDDKIAEDTNDNEEKKVLKFAVPPVVGRSKTPPRTTLSFKHTPPPSPGLMPGFTSPVPSVTDETVTDDFSTYDETNNTAGWTEDNPHVIHVVRKNTILPHGFTAMFSDAVERLGSYERDVYYITKTIGGDLMKWQARIPTDAAFPDFVGRCILVEGPGLDYIHAERKVVEESLASTVSLAKNDIPENVAKGFKRATAKLSHHFTRNKAKHTQYYLFVYPSGTVFDNAAISGKDAANKIKGYGIRINSKFGIFQRREHTNIIAFWAVATVADEDRRTDEFSAHIPSDLFDF